MCTFKLPKSDINLNLPKKFTFICFSSFEDRSSTVSEIIDRDSVQKAYVLHSISLEENENFKKNNEMIETALHRNIERLALDLEKPLAVANKLTVMVKAIIEEDTPNCERSLVVDVTTFTHEILLMLLKLLYVNSEHFKTVKCLYTGASSYSGYEGNSDPRYVWLSKGCRDVRSIIGYPGILEPTEKNILILLTGFEFERATKLVDILNPDCVIIGRGDTSTPTDYNHISTMKHMSNSFEEWIKINKKLVIGTFTFSCNDVEQARDDILSQIDEELGANYIIVPLNTKISTIATALVSFAKLAVQVCYTVPEIYNTTNYSIPGDNITIVDFMGAIGK